MKKYSWKFKFIRLFLLLSGAEWFAFRVNGKNDKEISVYGSREDREELRDALRRIDQCQKS